MNAYRSPQSNNGDQLGPSLILNAARIYVPDKEVEVFKAPYPGDGELDNLRKEYLGSYTFRRTREGLEAVATKADVASLGWTSELTGLRRNPRLISALVLDALIDKMLKLERPSPRRDPVTIYGGVNLLEGIDGSQCLPSWIESRSRFVVTTRTLFSKEGRQAPFLIVDVETSRTLKAPVQELMELGFDPVGRYVGPMVPNDDSRLADRLNILGGVEAIEGDQLILNSANGTAQRISISEAYVEPRHDIFTEVIALAAKSRTDSILEQLEKRLNDAHQASIKITKLQRMLQKLNESPLTILPGIHVKFGDFIEQGGPYLAEPQHAPQTTYVFDVGRSVVSTNNRAGLQNNGPYNWVSFTPTKPRFAIVCEEQLRGQVSAFLSKFRDGIKLNLRSGSGPYAHGFHRLFKTQEPSFDWFFTKDSSANEYKRVCNEIVDRSLASTPYDAVLLQNRETTKYLRSAMNPYLVSKATLLRAGIPSQSFVIEKTRLSDYDLSYVVADLALGTYSKLGGTPWLVAADQTIDHEIVIGLGSSWVSESRMGPKNRLVGITSLFTGDGNYLLSNLSKVAPIEQYFESLLRSLRIAIDQAKRDMSWQPGDGVRIVVHAFKPMKMNEIKAIKALVAELNDFDVHFAFVHVKEQHCYSLFDKNERGISERQGPGVKGRMAPARGTFVVLNDFESLVCLWGAKQMRLPEHGHPKPIMLELHKDSTFRDIGYLSRQLVTFASHSWRSFSVSRTPVTILYSDLVADLMGRLASIESWSPEVLPAALGKRRWFL